MVCPRCGVADNPADALYCENCGDQLRADGEAAAPSIAVSELPSAPAATPAAFHTAAPAAGAAEPSLPADAVPVASSVSENARPDAPEGALGATASAFDLDATIQLPRSGWVCAACGAENDESDGYCADCGAERVQGPAP